MPKQSQYATSTDLTSLAITVQAGNRFGAAMDAALSAASSIADAYISGQFQLPLQDGGWDMALRLHVCNIAAKLLYDQFGYNPGAPIDQLIERRYTEAISFLEKVRDKAVHPQWVDASSVTPDADSAGDFVISDAPVGFTGRGVSSAPIDPWDGGI